MKRSISLAVALMLVLSAVCCAAAEKTFTTAYFTITLPNGWDFSTEDASVDEDGSEYLGFFGEDRDIGMVVGAFMVYYKEFQDVSLWNSTKAELQDYADTVLYDFKDEEPEYLGTVMAGKIPFVLIKGTDEDGEYLHAETMTNGYAIEFQAFVLGADGETQYPMTDRYIEQFKSILATFLPVS